MVKKLRKISRNTMMDTFYSVSRCACGECGCTCQLTILWDGAAVWNEADYRDLFD